MARMIPPILDLSTPSPGERRIFDELRCAPGTDDWTVLHSLNLAKHVGQVCGEVDFVIVAPNLGVLCLEVKAVQRISRDQDGYWHIGRKTPSEKSPFDQADAQMRSIKRFLTSTDRDLSRVPVVWAVWFTHCSAEHLPPSLEWHSWQLLDQNDLTQPIAATLTMTMTKSRNHLSHMASGTLFSGPDSREAARIVRLLRPEFELAISWDTVRKERAIHLQRFTQEQFDALDTMENSARVLFTGPAGTGKTFLALEEARRAAAAGYSTLLVCYNKHLGRWLANMAPEGVAATTLHKYMCQVAGVQPPEQAPASWWERDLPDQAIDALLRNATEPVDVLIVDEAQDLCHPNYLDVLDLTVRGGLVAGSWRMFGDFERQAIFDRRAAEARLLNRVSGMVAAKLSRNCRNTPRVGQAVQLLSELQPGYRGFRRPDDGVEVVFQPYASYTDQEHKLVLAINTLIAEGIKQSEIVILSPVTSGVASRATHPKLAGRMVPLDVISSNKIRYGTIHAFKGLDAPAVVVTDIDEIHERSAQDLLYIAMTRSTGPLWVLVDRRLQRDIAALVLKGVASA